MTEKHYVVDTGKESAVFRQRVGVEFVSDDANLVSEAIRQMRVALIDHLRGCPNISVFWDPQTQVSFDIIQHAVEPTVNRPEEK